MDRFYVCPLTGEELTAKPTISMLSAAFQPYQVIRLKHAGITIDCVDDPDTMSMYINGLVPSSVKDKAIPALLDLVPAVLKEDVDITIEDSDENGIASLYLCIPDYSKLPMLDGEFLSEKIVYALYELIDKKREG